MSANMSNRTRDRARVVRKIVDHRLTHAEGAERLHLCVRQVKRLVSRYRAEGENGLVSRRLGTPANNRIASSVRREYMALVRERYVDCGPTLTHEKLVAFHGFSHSVETLRHWMIEDGIWTPRRRDNTSSDDACQVVALSTTSWRRPPPRAAGRLQASNPNA